ncbi:MAG: hypothetical protein ACD_32C00014G0014 [uncultured bacterium]|nr:MAG: hypothetical protein ACD_32C00014G0014 [uncultured bacterium]
MKTASMISSNYFPRKGIVIFVLILFVLFILQFISSKFFPLI